MNARFLFHSTHTFNLPLRRILVFTFYVLAFAVIVIWKCVGVKTQTASRCVPVCGSLYRYNEWDQSQMFQAAYVIFFAQVPVKGGVRQDPEGMSETPKAEKERQTAAVQVPRLEMN